MIKKVKFFVEFQAFGVCHKLGEKLGIAASSIRLFFIYTSFLALGSPLIVYLILAWIIDLRRHLRLRKSLSRDF
jgi:phage shock protein C